MPLPAPRASLPLRSRPQARAGWTRLALPTFAMLESAMAALGCASTAGPRPAEPRGTSEPGLTSASAAPDAADAKAPPNAVAGAPRTILDPSVVGVTTIALPAPRRRAYAVGGAGPMVDPTPPAHVALTIRGGTPDDRAVLASQRKQVRQCADRADAMAHVVGLDVEITADGVARELAGRPGPDPEVAACLGQLVRRSHFRMEPSRRALEVELEIEPSVDAP